MSLSNSTTPYSLGSFTKYPNISAPFSNLAAFFTIGENPCPKNILSPNTRATLSFPIKSPPIIKASAKPFGFSCILYWIFHS